jgi:hypothetical protein
MGNKFWKDKTNYVLIAGVLSVATIFADSIFLPFRTGRIGRVEVCEGVLDVLREKTRIFGEARGYSLWDGTNKVGDVQMDNLFKGGSVNVGESNEVYSVDWAVGPYKVQKRTAK